MSINDVINEIKSLRGSNVEIFERMVKLDQEIDELEIDVVDILESVKENEVKDLVIHEYSEEIDDYKEVTFYDVDEYLDRLWDEMVIEEVRHNNTYNWLAPVTNHIDFTEYEMVSGEYLVELKVHKYGDIRGNYTDTVLLKFDSADEFYEKLAENNKTIEYEDYEVYVNLFSDGKEVFKDGMYVYTSYETSFQGLKSELDEEFGISKKKNNAKESAELEI